MKTAEEQGKLTGEEIIPVRLVCLVTISLLSELSFRLPVGYL